MAGYPRPASADADAYRRRAGLLDRAARAPEVSANLHEYYASRCFHDDLAVDAHRHADHSREAAAQSRSRSDDHNAIADGHETGIAAVG